MDTQSDKAQRLLVLGDGNFSFSLALCRYMVSLPVVEQCAVLATSFDDYGSLVDKYPETKNVLQSITCRYGGTVQHEINATQSLPTQLRSDALFDHIVFNFPHLGIEDAYLHSHLLGHIFYRCHEAVTTSGNVYISLAEGQAKRWRLKDMALKNGFQYVSSGIFLQQLLPGYEMKRHQTGRSFCARLEDTRYYVFRKSESTDHADDVMGSLLAAVSALTVSSMPGHADITLKDSSVAGSGAGEEESVMNDCKMGNKRSRDCTELSSSPSTSHDKKKMNMQDKKLEKKKSAAKGRGRMTAAEGGYHCVPSETLTTETGAPVSEFECKTCSKRFKLEQGARTHVYMLHILGQQEIFSTFEEKTAKIIQLDVADVDQSGGNSTLIDSATDETKGEGRMLYCPNCPDDGERRIFRNEEALYQHIRAKHKTLLLPEAGRVHVAGKSSTTDTHNDGIVSGPSCACPACDLCFESDIELLNHLVDGISPPAVVKAQCDKCKRFFQNDRGLAQHMLSCVTGL